MKRFFLCLLLLFPVVCGFAKGRQNHNFANVVKFSNACDIIESHSLERVSGDSLTEAAIRAMLKSLDPHSRYQTASEALRAAQKMDGKFYGIGISVRVIDDTACVVAVMGKSPALRAGIEIGDKILKVNGHPATGGSFVSAAMDSIKGRKGTSVTVTIKRGDSGSDLTIRRNEIPYKSLDAAYMLSDSVGYIHINAFARTTEDEAVSAIENLKKSGARSLVIDLRDNPGGLVSSSIGLLSQFIARDTLLCRVQNRNGGVKKYKSRNGCQTFLDMPIVVAINSHSASASEIFAGAVQDLGRGLVIGSRSFGKGLVQNTYKLSDGSEIILTTGRYLTPHGRSLQKPYKNGKFITGDSVQVGGIEPDVVVNDSASTPPLLTLMLRDGLFYKVLLRYYTDNAESIKSCANARTFSALFDREGVVNCLREALDASGADYTDTEFEEAESEIARQSKIILAGFAFDTVGMYQVLNENSEVTAKAVDILKGKN